MSVQILISDRNSPNHTDIHGNERKHMEFKAEHAINKM